METLSSFWPPSASGVAHEVVISLRRRRHWPRDGAPARGAAPAVAKLRLSLQLRRKISWGRCHRNRLNSMRFVVEVYSVSSSKGVHTVCVCYRKNRATPLSQRSCRMEWILDKCYSIRILHGQVDSSEWMSRMCLLYCSSSERLKVWGAWGLGHSHNLLKRNAGAKAKVETQMHMRTTWRRTGRMHLVACLYDWHQRSREHSKSSRSCSTWELAKGTGVVFHGGTARAGEGASWRREHGRRQKQQEAQSDRMLDLLIPECLEQSSTATVCVHAPLARRRRSRRRAALPKTVPGRYVPCMYSALQVQFPRSKSRCLAAFAFAS